MKTAGNAVMLCLVALALVLVGTQAAQSADKTVIRIGSPFKAGTILVDAAEKFRDLVARGSDGRIDILVNCAGIWMPDHSLLDTEESKWDRVIAVNLKGTFLCCQAAGLKMREQRSGSIINLSSQVGLNPGTLTGSYSVSKAGIIMLTRQLALELGLFHIRVNALAPGIVKTDFNKQIWQGDSEGRLADSVPLGRLGEPGDIGGAVVFLASEVSSYITGAVIPIDGGWSAPNTRSL